MTRIEYSYCVIRYAHDPAADERLNVGVVLYAPGTGQLSARCESRYQRLSDAFAGFDGERYKTAIRAFERGIASIAETLSGNLFEADERAALPDAAAIVRRAWPDQGLAFQAGPALCGVSEDPVRELDDLFDRFVTSRYEREVSPRRDDGAVWNAFSPRLAEHRVAQVLRPHRFRIFDEDVQFDHAFQNERWHVLLPVSFDYVDPESITRKAFTTLGRGLGLAQTEDFGQMYVLLGRPIRAERERQYESAKRMIQETLPILHELVEEENAARFAERLARNLRQHGVIADEGGDKTS